MNRRLIFRALLAGLLSALTIPFMGCGAVGVYAQQHDPTMQSSGPEFVTAYNVQENTTTCEEKLAGEGSLGQFTYRGLRVDSNDFTVTDACPNGNLQVAGGAGIFRFSDGSLMSVNVTGGSICIDANELGHLTETYQVTGGTGRFQNATGALSHTATLNVVLSDLSGNPVLLTHTGEFNGTVIGAAAQGQQQ
ncbi:MAG: hypothetical protein KGL59_06560 [Acidobacteriota bacterium]|nr:hypothetical protein [Acidobacteriota bacterium]